MTDTYDFEAASINYVLLFGQVDLLEGHSSKSRKNIIFEPHYKPDGPATRELFDYLVKQQGQHAIKWDTVIARTERVHYTTHTFDETGSDGDNFTVDFETVDGRQWCCSVPIESMAQTLNELPVIPGSNRIGEIARFVLKNRPYEGNEGFTVPVQGFPVFNLLKGAKAKVYPLYTYTSGGSIEFAPGSRTENFRSRLEGY